MKTLLILLFFFMAFFFVVGVLYDRQKERTKIAHKEWLNEIHHDHSISSYSLLNALLIDESSDSLIILQDLDQEEYDYEEISHKRILEVSLVEDNQIIYAFPKHGVLGTEGYSKEDEDETDDEEDYVENLMLKVLIDDLKHPLKVFTCIDQDDYLLRDSEEYSDAFDECEDWYHKLVILIKRAEKSRSLVGTS